jgi:hypothetical protein
MEYPNRWKHLLRIDAEEGREVSYYACNKARDCYKKYGFHILTGTGELYFMPLA